MRVCGRSNVRRALVVSRASTSGDAERATPEVGLEAEAEEASAAVPSLYKAEGANRTSRSNLPRPLFLLEISAEEASKRDVDLVVGQCVETGLANAVLLRDGNLSTATMLQSAATLYSICSALDIKMIVEDRIEVAAAKYADGFLANGVDTGLVRTVLEQVSPRLSMLDSEDDEDSTVFDIDDEKVGIYEDANDVDEVGEGGSDGEGLGAERAMDVISNGVPLEDKEEVVEANEEADSHLLMGCVVNSVSTAKQASLEEFDFVLIEENGASKSSSAILTLQDIRKELSSHMILTSKFCRSVGGPKSSFNVGADGIQIPLPEAKRLLSCVKEFQRAGLPKSGRLLGAILLIAGSTVGAGIIAMPVRTGQAGFIPTLATLFASWLFMNLTAMLLVEASLWYGPKANVLSMAGNTLGVYGRSISMALYLFIYAATLTAYLSEGSAMSTPLFSKLLGRDIPSWLGTSAFTVISGLALYSGPKRIDLLNRVCVYIALYSFLHLIVRCGMNLQPAFLARGNWQACTTCIPIMVVAFTFHNIVPSLVGYLGNSRDAVKAIVIGSSIPLVLYIIWQAIILGTLPEQLVYTLNCGADVVAAIAGVTSDQLSRHVTIFSFFAIVTSLLGIGLGCVDFVKDALPSTWMVRKQSSQIVPLFVTLIPPLVISLVCPGVFYKALEFSGTFRLVLFGIMPALMVWSGRRKGELAWIPGGNLPLLTVFGLSTFFICTEIWIKTNLKALLPKVMVRALGG